jgi:hypothetical protein
MSTSVSRHVKKDRFACLTGTDVDSNNGAAISRKHLGFCMSATRPASKKRGLFVAVSFSSSSVLSFVGRFRYIVLPL